MAQARFQHGFSLIEVIAAFLIFALGFGVLLQILTSSLHVAQRSEAYTQAALWAQSTLDVVGVGELLEEGQASGRFDDRYRWDMDIHRVDPGDVTDATEDERLAIELYQVDLFVRWGSPGREHEARFSTIRAVDMNQQKVRMARGRAR